MCYIWYIKHMTLSAVDEYIASQEAPYLQSLIWIKALIPHTCSRGPLQGSRSADYLFAASRTTYNIPLPGALFCSQALICMNKPGLIRSQKCQPTICTSEGSKGNLTSPYSSTTGQSLVHNRSCCTECTESQSGLIQDFFFFFFLKRIF